MSEKSGEPTSPVIDSSSAESSSARKRTDEPAPPPRGPAVMPRRYPVPAPLLTRLALLCVRPEEWALAARYPLRVTVLPMLLAMVLAASLMAIANGRAALVAARDFAAHYDQRHPRMIFSDGKLSVEPAAGKYLPRFAITAMPFYMQPLEVVVDPTNQTNAEALAYDHAIVVTDTQIVQRWWGGQPVAQPLANLQQSLPEPNAKWVIDTPHLLAALDTDGWALAAASGGMTFGYYMLKESLWALAMVLLVAPLVALGAPNLSIPRRVTYRVALAVQVPLVLLGAGLDLVGYSPARAFPALPPDWAVVFWALTTAGLALWAGILVGQMFTPQRHARRGM